MAILGLFFLHFLSVVIGFSWVGGVDPASCKSRENSLFLLLSRLVKVDRCCT